LSRSKGAYQKAERKKVPTLPAPAEPLNVVLVIEESLGRGRMSLYGHTARTTPHLEAWARAQPDAFTAFEHPLTNSGNTSVVVPMLLTGLAPSASFEDLHSAPFLWQYAGALGYRTLLLSAQSFRYAAFDAYFLSTKPDVVFTADADDIELVNGGGMDDRAFQKHVTRAIVESARAPKPFFAVLQYNATHHPILRLPPLRPELAGQTQERRYDNAVALLDQLLDDLKNTLSAQGVLDRTLIIVTSDHGENLGQHPRHRTQSYYEEVLAIPLMIYTPEKLCRARPEACSAVRENSVLRVSNLDIPATVLDALGLLHRPELASLTKLFAGQSLFSKLPDDRIIYALNNTAARHWVNEGFALVRKHEKYMFSERGGHEYYDLSQDPGEKYNRFAELRPIPNWIVDAIRVAPAYRAILLEHARRGDPLRAAVEAR
jgi:glucan phosphoethanolaminetransferase (alkaline phosphatase superfamily)